MDRKVLVAVLCLILIAGCTEDPLTTQAKEQLAAAKTAVDSFQNQVQALPSLSFSKEVKDDFRLQTSYLEMASKLDIVAGEQGQQPAPEFMAAAMMYMVSGQQKGIEKLKGDQGFDYIFKSGNDVYDLTKADLEKMDSLADQYDQTINVLKSSIPQLLQMSAERNEKTEAQYKEYEQLQVRYQGLVGMVNSGNSTQFKQKIDKLKQANDAFSSIVQFYAGMGDQGFPTPAFSASIPYPELSEQETAIKNCWTQSRDPVKCDAQNFFKQLINPYAIEVKNKWQGLQAEIQ